MRGSQLLPCGTPLPGALTFFSPLGGIINSRIAALASAAVLGTALLPVAGARAATTDLYVNSNPGAHCTDQGTGLESAPYCTVQAAANVVVAGQTVHIAAGNYPEQVTLTHSGTAAAPITFIGGSDSLGPWGNWDPTYAQIGNTDWKHPVDHSVVISNAQHLVINGFQGASPQQEAFVVDNSSDITLMRSSAYSMTQTDGVKVTNGSSKVTLGRFRTGGIGIDHASDTVVTGSDTGAVLVTDAPGTILVNNTVSTNCHDGLVLTGASTGATLENNVINTDTMSYPPKPCGADTNHTGIRVMSGATTGTKADFNVIAPLSGGPAYDWADQAYNTQADFTTATSQGGHDFVADPSIGQSPAKVPTSPILDSADENAPGMLPVDMTGRPAADDPVIPNTGTGSGIRDRGAWENYNFGSVYTPAGPTRLLDTRDGIGAVKAGQTLDLQVAGVAGVPATGVTAVTLNVTVTAPTAPGFLTAYPHGRQLPTASNLNWTANTTIANLVTVPVVDGKVSFYAGGPAGSTHVIADLAGYYSNKGSVFTAAGPTRIMDTRGGTKLAQGGNTIDLQVAGVKGIPATGVTAVTLNVTAVKPQSGGFLTVFPHGQARPKASNLNWSPGQIIANLVTVPVVDGKVSFYAGGPAGSVDILADVAGYYSADGYDTYHADGPYRLMDTRIDQEYRASGAPTRKAAPVPAGGTLVVDLGEMPEPYAVTLNVTITRPTAPGFLTVYPHGTDRPLASNLNWVAGQTIPNQVVVPVKDHKISLYNGSWGPVDMVVDLFGYQQ
ncbi:right-handed parallel beta-helix repeat-containing protein [Kitasatospora sp. NPDC002227]|uniref:right-handed parallel beta-helix repeat-containing protein n=1 Tax=Kitasatospora sp. NPDC002227 TaxID=3154773 RepID=UPI003318FFD4